MMKSVGVEEYIDGGFNTHSRWLPYWTACPWVNGVHPAHFMVIGGRFYKTGGKGLILPNSLAINGDNVDLNWLFGAKGVIYSWFSGVEFVA